MKQSFNPKGFRLFALIGLFLAFSISLLAADISIKAKNEPLKKVLDQITAQTGYEFAYSEAVNPSAIKVNVNADKKDVIKFFDEFFNEIGLSYKIVGKAVSLSPKGAENKVAANSEKIKVSGKIMDDNGEPLPGVYVFVVGTKTGTTSDFDGNYAIECKPGDKLRFSFMGFKDFEKVVGQSLTSFKNVVLQEDAIALESTVVIGYGNTQKMKDVTGAISHVGAKEIQQAAMGSNITSLLQGRAAGVNVQMQSASPTSPVSVVVRGQSSINGNNQPLWIIDGIPEYNDGVDGTVSNVLYSLNLNDVESIDILKDASSTAIYGSRAANGVIIVTTKSGKEGMKPTLEVSAKVGIQFQDFNSYDYFNAAEYIAFTRESMREEAFCTGNITGSYMPYYLDQQAFYNMNTSEFNRNSIKDLEGAYYTGNDTDWVGLMTQNPIQQQYDATLRGGMKAVSYLASVSYRDNQGIVRTGYNKMFSGRLRLEARVSDAIKLRFNASGSTRNASSKDGMMELIKNVRPDMPVYNEDGSIYNKDSSTENPYTLLNDKNYSTGENLAANMEFEWKFLNDFMFTSKGSLNYANSESLSYVNSKYYASGSPTLATRSWSRPKSDTKVWDNTLLYTKVIGKHDISASLTASMEKYQNLYYAIGAEGFPDDNVLNSFANAITKTNMNETYVARSLMSQIARVQYNYDSKYLATFTIRRDGSSRFGKDRRWGWFPSFGLGWTVTNEKFFKNWNIEDILSFLKVRFSYGKSGSQNLSDYQWLTMVSSNLYNEQAGIAPKSLGNDELSWEETLMTDVALEMEFWKSRIRASVGYFQKKANDLIFSDTVPGTSGFTTITTNIGSTTTKGVEFSFDIDIVKNSKWQLTYSLNGASNKTMVDQFRSAGYTYIGEYTQIEVGQEVGQYYGYKTYHRLFGSAEEAAALRPRKDNGDIDNYRSNNTESAGDVYFVDLNGDGKITSDDQTYIGTSVPKLYGGMGLQLYIGTSFNVGATFSYSIGNERYWDMPAGDTGWTGNFNQSNKIAGMSAVLSKNSPYNATTMPRATPNGAGRNNMFSDYWLYDASYLRLNALNMSYRLDKRYFGNTIVDNIEFTLQASNLFTLTRYPGFDPQGNFSTNTSLLGEMGIDSSIYPSARTFTAGVKITFR
ncbi:MAG: SusC/RagA family TonB-linked outer membrane protein [Bacteroidales bacterium]|nr:SusC/RagA family TonB-linked outer membrane protein [Bacteroidales bacterium]